MEKRENLKKFFVGATLYRNGRKWMAIDDVVRIPRHTWHVALIGRWLNEKAPTCMVISIINAHALMCYYGNIAYINGHRWHVERNENKPINKGGLKNEKNTTD